MTVFITGSSGFVGLALTEALLAEGRDVVGYDLAAPRAAAAAAFGILPGRFHFVRGDVTDEGALRSSMSEHDCSHLVTLAAITADASRERSAPGRIFAVNTGGAIAAIAAAAACGVRRVLHVSSGSVYGASGRQAELLDELATPLLPEGLYGISKQAAEAAALRLGALHGLDVRIGRLGTCFGPWEFDTGVRDTLSAPLQVVHHMLRGNQAVLARPGRRDWLYVRDAAAALIALLDAQVGGDAADQVFNVAAGFEWTIADWCEAIGRARPQFGWRLAAGEESPNVHFYAPYDRASMSNRRLRAATRFTPRFDLEAAAVDFQSWLAVHAAPAPQGT
jgi:UDP-glucuronate 4-epimerase